MAFELMNKHIFEIDITPESQTPTYAQLAKGINSAEVSFNEETDQSKYFDNDGWGETDVIGAQMTISFGGHRYYGDQAQDYIFSTALDLGKGRRTNFRHTEPDGGIYEGPCTIVNVAPGSGEAGAKGEISFEVHVNGKPVHTPPTP